MASHSTHTHTLAGDDRRDPASRPRYPKTRVAYELPATIKSIQAGWQATFQSSSIIAALFTVIESIFLYFFSGVRTASSNPESAGIQALLVFTYLAFFFSLSATFSSLLLTDELGEVQVRASQRESWLGPPDDLVIHEDPSKLLTHYGVRKTWRPVMWHWFIMLFLGYLCVIGQVLVYVWVMETKPVAIAMTCVASICLLPLLSILPFQ